VRLGWAGAAWVWVERDSQLDLDVRAVDVYVLDEQTHQLPALLAAELIDHGTDLFGEVADLSTEQIAAREGGSLGGQRGTFGGQLVVTAGDFAPTALQFRHFDQAGLEKIDEPTFFGGSVIDLAFQPSKLGGKALVIGDRL